MVGFQRWECLGLLEVLPTGRTVNAHAFAELFGLYVDCQNVFGKAIEHPGSWPGILKPCGMGHIWLHQLTVFRSPEGRTPSTVLRRGCIGLRWQCVIIGKSGRDIEVGWQQHAHTTAFEAVWGGRSRAFGSTTSIPKG